MSKKKHPETKVEIKGMKHSVFEQRMPIRKEYGGKVYYESNFVRMGEVEAVNAEEAILLAKKRGLSEKPVVWSEFTEGQRDRYKRSSHFRDDD